MRPRARRGPRDATHGPSSPPRSPPPSPQADATRTPCFTELTNFNLLPMLHSLGFAVVEQSVLFDVQIAHLVREPAAKA